MKPDDVEIKNISVSPNNVIYGLGGDNMVYVWTKTDGAWKLHTQDYENA